MSDTEPQEEDVADMVAEMEKPADEPLNFHTALQQVLRTSLYSDGLARGLKESVKALDQKDAHLCILSSSCDEPSYNKLVAALCSEHNIPLVKVESSKILGEWAGLCKIDQDGKPRKVVACSCVVIRQWGTDTAARRVVMEEIKATA